MKTYELSIRQKWAKFLHIKAQYNKGGGGFLVIMWKTPKNEAWKGGGYLRRAMILTKEILGMPPKFLLLFFYFE